MQNILKNKGGKTTKKKLVIDVKITTTLVNMVDVHVGTTRSKETKYKDSKNVANWEVEECLKKSMVETI